MTQADFHILKNQDEKQRQLYACQLIQKAFQQGHRILVLTSSEEEKQLMDELLWHFRPESYVPHVVQGSAAEIEAPVLLIHAGDAEHHHDVLLNLGDDVPPFVGRFKRYLHLANEIPQKLDASRAAYRFFSQRGYPVNYYPR